MCRCGPKTEAKHGDEGWDFLFSRNAVWLNKTERSEIEIIVYCLYKGGCATDRDRMNSCKSKVRNAGEQYTSLITAIHLLLVHASCSDAQLPIYLKPKLKILLDHLESWMPYICVRFDLPSLICFGIKGLAFLFIQHPSTYFFDVVRLWEQI
jgi:hypothetical protein